MSPSKILRFSTLGSAQRAVSRKSKLPHIFRGGHKSWVEEFVPLWKLLRIEFCVQVKCSAGSPSNQMFSQQKWIVSIAECPANTEKYSEIPVQTFLSSSRLLKCDNTSTLNVLPLFEWLREETSGPETRCHDVPRAIASVLSTSSF